MNGLPGVMTLWSHEGFFLGGTRAPIATIFSRRPASTCRERVSDAEQSVLVLN